MTEEREGLEAELHPTSGHQLKMHRERILLSLSVQEQLVGKVRDAAALSHLFALALPLHKCSSAHGTALVAGLRKKGESHSCPQSWDFGFSSSVRQKRASNSGLSPSGDCSSCCAALEKKMRQHCKHLWAVKCHRAEVAGARH